MGESSSSFYSKPSSTFARKEKNVQISAEYDVSTYKHNFCNEHSCSNPFLVENVQLKPITDPSDPLHPAYHGNVLIRLEVQDFRRKKGHQKPLLCTLGSDCSTTVRNTKRCKFLKNLWMPAWEPDSTSINPWSTGIEKKSNGWQNPLEMWMVSCGNEENKEYFSVNKKICRLISSRKILFRKAF